MCVTRFLPGNEKYVFPEKIPNFCTLKNIWTFHAVSPKVISLFSKIWILREAMTLPFKTHLVPVQSFRQRNLQLPRSTPMPPTGSQLLPSRVLYHKIQLSAL